MSCYLVNAVDDSHTVELRDQVKIELASGDLEKNHLKSGNKIGKHCPISPQSPLITSNSFQFDCEPTLKKDTS